MITTSKHPERDFSVTLPHLAGGLNVSVPPHVVGLDQIADGWNVWMSPDGQFESRPGMTVVTEAALAKRIDGGFYSPTLSKTLLVCDQKLYTLNETTGATSEVGAVSGANAPSFADFRGKCFIATGGALQMYDGTTLAAVTSLTSNPAPAYALYLQAWNNRLWVAETGSKVCFSGTRDFEDWGGGISDSGGFLYVEDGDGAQVTGLGMLEGMPIVFKGNVSGGPYTIARINGSSVDDFAAETLTKDLSCVNGRTVKNFLNDLLFVGQEGLYSHRQVQDYTNPRVFPMSLRVSPLFQAYAPLDGVYDPVTGNYFLVTSLPVLVYHVPTESWYQWKTGFVPKSCFLGSAGGVLFGAEDGHVYRFKRDSGVYTDNGELFISSFTTGVINVDGPAREKLWKWLHIALSPLSDGSFSVEWRKNFGFSYVSAQSEAVSSDLVLGWDGGFCWDEDGIGWDQDSFLTRRRRMSYRGRDLQVRVASNGGFRLTSLTVTGATLRGAGDTWR